MVNVSQLQNISLSFLSLFSVYARIDRIEAKEKEQIVSMRLTKKSYMYY